MTQTRPCAVLVACCGRKLPHAAPAQELYQSDLFRKARAYAERAGRWLILSAEHGVVAPDDVLAPYDRTLDGMSRAERLQWAERVRRRLSPAEHYVVLAGEKYCGWIDPSFSVERPLLGLGIGQQLSWLKKELDATSS